MAKRLNRPIKIFPIGKGDERDYFLPFKIARITKNVKPDIVHTRNWATIDGVIGAKIAGVKHVIHGEHGREAADPGGSNVLRKKARKVLNPWVSKFVTVSAELRNWLLNDVGLPEKKILQIINGVDIESIKPAENKKLSKSALGIDPNSFVIGTVARLDPVKDHETIFRAFRTFCDCNGIKKMILLVAGSGPLQESLKVLAEELKISKNVLFVGHKDNVNQLYDCMDVYVLASIAEGISNTILEAMACGLPVVATGVGGSPELVDDGKTGFIFTSGDYRELAERISFYFNNLSVLRDHGFNGRMRAEERFSLKRMLKEYEKLYCTVAEY